MIDFTVLIKIPINFFNSLFMFFKNLFLKFKNRNRFFVEDFINQEKDSFYYKKLGIDKYGVFRSGNPEAIRTYQKPEHNTPKKFAKQFAKKLATKEAKLKLKQL